MSTAGLIYVAGNPDLYPLEYYDPESDTYQGVIPAFLERFAQDTGYELRYLQPGETDRRTELAQNQQVDIVSGCVGSEIEGEQITLFRAETGGAATEYRLVLTSAAPESLEQALRGYLSDVKQSEWTGSVLHTVQSDPQDSALLPLTAGLGLVACLLLAALALLYRRSRRQLRLAVESRLYDPDTGLHTEEYLLRRFPSFVNDKNRSLYYISYFYLNLAHVEWRDGQEAAVALLRYAAEAVGQQVGADGIVCRTSGGGLAALMSAGSSQATEESCATAVEQIRAFAKDAGCFCDIAAGIYPLQSGDYDLHRILFMAQQCAHTAFREGMDCLVCSESQRRTAEEERQLVADIDRGFAQEQFQVYLQFYVSSARRQVVGGEMLARWQHLQKGLLFPGQFVPLMEREGIVSRLDYYCLEKVCAFLEMLDRNDVRDFFISCNFARSTITSPDFVQRCQEIISRYHFIRELLIIEVTESEKSSDYAQMTAHLQAMRAFGVRVIFDDFGAGFSSFRDLQEYAMDGLKLDKYLVENIGTKQGRSILDAMIRAGHALGMTILAEGVEDDQQAQMLQQLHCDVLQGFYSSHPIPAGEAAKKIIAQFRSPDDAPKRDGDG